MLDLKTVFHVTCIRYEFHEEVQKVPPQAIDEAGPYAQYILLDAGQTCISPPVNVLEGTGYVPA